MVDGACDHITGITKVVRAKQRVCEECVKTGAQWVHLRTCQTCGVTLCCDSSPNRHTTKHARATHHPVVASAEPGERWLYCYPDDAFAEYQVEDDAMSDDRKYRQRGYQDDSRAREPKRTKPVEREPRAPGRPLQDASGPRTPNLMASHEVFRCARCGNLLPLPVEAAHRCARCGTDLHSCVQCLSFDTSARFECSQPSLQARVSPKEARNECALFAPRTTIERQTGQAGTATGQTTARQAFDDLFK